LPVDKKRIKLWGTVSPEALAFLESLGEKNHGRAIDRAVGILMSAPVLCIGEKAAELLATQQA